MKLYFIFVILSFLPIMLCGVGGIRAAINETLITSMLKHFQTDINSLMKEIDIGNFHIWFNIYGRNVKLHFPDNFLSYFDVKLINGGINIKSTKSLTATCTGKVRFDFVIGSTSKKLTITVSNFLIDANFKISSEKMESGGYRPKVELMSDPSVSAKIKVSSGGLIGKVISILSNLLISIFKKKIINMGVDEGEGQIKKIVDKLETEVTIKQNLILDYSLIDPIKVTNQFIELNAYGVLYNKNMEKTKKLKNNYSLTQLPYISKMEKQFQLYVSEYSINSAAYTYLETYYKPLNFDISSDVANILLPGFSEVFNDKKAHINLKYQSIPKIKITENGLIVKAPSLFTVTVESRQKPAFYSEIELTLGIKLDVEYGPSVTGKITDLSAKLGTIYIKDACKSNSLIELGFNVIENTVIKLINLLAQDMKYDFKPIMDIQFKDIKLENKNGYLVVYYNVNK